MVYHALSQDHSVGSHVRELLVMMMVNDLVTLSSSMIIRFSCDVSLHCTTQPAFISSCASCAGVAATGEVASGVRFHSVSGGNIWS